MNKKFKIFWLMGIFFLLPIFSSLAASGMRPTLVTPLSEFEQSFKKLIKKASIEKQFFGSQIEKIYLYGWSKKGLLAYGIDTIGDCDIYDRIVVKDLVTDIELFACDGSCNVENDGILNKKGDRIAFPSFDESWNFNWPTVSSYFKKTGIRFAKKPKLRQFPLDLKYDRIAAKVTTKVKKETLEIKGMELIIESKMRGRKVVHSETFDADSNLGFPILVKILGYLRSPYERRLGIVLARQFLLENGKVSTHLDIYGAALTAGYSQQPE